MERVRRRDFHKSRNYYLAVASEWAGPLLHATAKIVAGSPTPRENWRRGLIIGHTHIGDVLYRTASLERLAGCIPDCRWDYLAAPVSAPVLEGNTAISRALPFVTGENSWNLSKDAFAALKSERYDVALCTNTLRHYPDLALAVALKIPNRVGFSDHGLSALVTHPIRIKRPLPYPAYFAAMVKQLCGIARDWPIRPKVFLDRRHHEAANDFVGVFAAENAPLIACCPTARQSNGVWPDEFFIEVLNAVGSKMKAGILLCGGPGDRIRLINAARGLTLPNKVMAGELDLLSFAALLARAHVVFAQDSGSRHLANAVGIPVVFVRNLSYDPIEAGQYCDSEEDAAPAAGPVREDDLKMVQSRVSPDAVATRIVSRIRSGAR